MPARLASTTAGEAPVAAGRVLRVRAYATPAYVAQVADWERHVQALLEDASVTLAASVDARLELDTADAWDARSADRLEPALAALRAKDPGDGVDLVIGFIGGLPTLSASFHEAGMSENPGKHLVLRAPDTARDLDAIDRAFDELSDEDRARLRRERRRHREVAVLLHEVGHALGAPHDAERASLMNPTYDPSMSRYSAPALAAMRAALSPPAAPPIATQSQPPTPTPSPPPPPVPGLTPPDEALFHDTLTAAATDPAAAYALAKPLFARYPSSLPVQDLRCKLALAAGLTWDATRAECDAVTKLTMRPDAKVP
jgi:hypothetical protein